jgi:putative two-component system response regulator
VGKIGIPDAILQKPGPLNPDELKVMRDHVRIGGQIIGEHTHGLLATAARIALTHHEKWDGSGYPAGLQGDAIPLEGRIAAIADVFDALTTVRPYKAAWSEADAVAYLVDQRGRHFDPALVDLFIGCLDQVREVMRQWPEPSPVA